MNYTLYVLYEFGNPNYSYNLFYMFNQWWLLIFRRQHKFWITKKNLFFYFFCFYSWILTFSTFINLHEKRMILCNIKWFSLICWHLLVNIFISLSTAGIEKYYDVKRIYYYYLCYFIVVSYYNKKNSHRFSLLCNTLIYNLVSTIENTL